MWCVWESGSEEEEEEVVVNCAGLVAGGLFVDGPGAGAIPPITGGVLLLVAVKGDSADVLSPAGILNSQEKPVYGALQSHPS